MLEVIDRGGVCSSSSVPTGVLGVTTGVVGRSFFAIGGFGLRDLTWRIRDHSSPS